MSPAAHKGFPLALAQEDEVVRILGYRADKGIERKMRDMGMPIGAEVKIIQHKGAGVVLANGHGRIALGSSAAQLVYVELINDVKGCTAERCAAMGNMTGMGPRMGPKLGLGPKMGRGPRMGIRSWIKSPLR